MPTRPSPLLPSPFPSFDVTRQNRLTRSHRMIEQTISDVDLLKQKVRQPPQRSPPPDFLCPITRAVMHCPMVTCDGHTYEKQAIKQWLERNTTSPRTGLVLRSNRLVPNYALKGAIEEHFNRGSVGGVAEGGSPCGSGSNGGSGGSGCV